MPCRRLGQVLWRGLGQVLWRGLGKVAHLVGHQQAAHPEACLGHPRLQPGLLEGPGDGVGHVVERDVGRRRQPQIFYRLIGKSMRDQRVPTDERQPVPLTDGPRGGQ
ncbi:hypothetical protein HNR40_005291 [Nonomuraea endophytica]|uniref:Uncharacterized protein n=1 Tax=Nonomuraea endophytica TaxID=714136 RepID=A0A7W8A6V4_9ACTN|nr:hypothetical protein [Nonomuraea endophytica]